MIAMIFSTMILLQNGDVTPITITCGQNKMGVRVCKVKHPDTRICLPVLPIGDMKNAPNLYCHSDGNHATYTAGY